jgi:hypothetical protein
MKNPHVKRNRISNQVQKVVHGVGNRGVTERAEEREREKKSEHA